jgi:hypothetical protein
MKKLACNKSPNDMGMADLMTELASLRQTLLQNTQGDFDTVQTLSEISQIIGIRKSLELVESAKTKEEAVNRIVHHLISNYK